MSERSPHLAPLKRVGHKGADLIAPGNTLASFRAALDAGADMIEFDVAQAPGGELMLAHGPTEAARPDATTLADGLDHFATEAFAGVELDVDLKWPGYEREVVEALAARGLVERSLVSSTYMETMDVLGRIEPRVRRGWSVPRAKRDYTRSLLAPGAYALLRAVRLWLPRRAGAMIRAGRFEAIMSHFLLVSPRLVHAVRTAGGQTYVWTVDDARRIAHLSAMGVDGVITNDPRLFG